jgi:hypothetical protein
MQLAVVYGSIQICGVACGWVEVVIGQHAEFLLFVCPNVKSIIFLILCSFRQWTSFLAAASTSGYVYMYSFYYFFFKTK